MAILLLFTLLLIYILWSISIEDIRTMLISENKLIIFAISGIFYLAYLDFSNETVHFLHLILNNSFSVLILFLIMYFLSYTSSKLFRVNTLGMGDIKLSSISVVWLGIELAFISLVISFLISAIYGLHGKITKKFKPFHQYPFAPFLSIGIYCSWILDKI